jgi:hypothetical protein
MRILHSKKLIFISKPRCGSTSIRRLLDSKMVNGDEYSDYGNENPRLHPHMSLPSIMEYLADTKGNCSDYQAFIFTRNPLAMLWSYYKYFKPDNNFRYNYNKDHNPDIISSYHDWLLNGKVGIGEWGKLCPSFISNTDFTPLSLEAHICNSENRKLNVKIFQLEKINECSEWLSDFFNEKLNVAELNKSERSMIPPIEGDALARVIECFPLESKLYNLNKVPGL